MTNQSWYEGADRRERLLDALERNQLDLLLALTPENAHYLAGDGDFIATHWRLPGLFSVASGAGGQTAVVAREFRRDPQSASPPYEPFSYTGWTETLDIRKTPGDSLQERVRLARPAVVTRPAQFDFDEIFDQIARAVQSVAPRASRVGVDSETVDTASMSRLQRRLPGAELIDASAIFDDLRAIKDADEIEMLRRAAELTEIGIATATSGMQIGDSELSVNNRYHFSVGEAADQDERFARFRGSEGVASAGLGVDSAGTVAPGETVKFDMQVDVGGYHSDIGRTYAFDPTPDQQAIYDALYHALHELWKGVRPGITFAELHAIGTRAMHDAGFPTYSRGHLGHSDGLTQHFEEPPFIAPGEHRPLVENMVLSVELPLYLYGVGAFQMERMVLVTKDGFALMDHLPFELSLRHRAG